MHCALQITRHVTQWMPKIHGNLVSFEKKKNSSNQMNTIIGWPLFITQTNTKNAPATVDSCSLILNFVHWKWKKEEEEKTRRTWRQKETRAEIGWPISYHIACLFYVSWVHAVRQCKRCARVCFPIAFHFYFFFLSFNETRYCALSRQCVLRLSAFFFVRDSDEYFR